MEMEKLDRLFEQARGTFAIEGMDLTKDDEQMIKQFFKGEITREEIIQDLQKS